MGIDVYDWLLNIGNAIYDKGALFEALCLLVVLILCLLTVRDSVKTKKLLAEAKANNQRVLDIRSGKLHPHKDIVISHKGVRTETNQFK